MGIKSSGNCLSSLASTQGVILMMAQRLPWDFMSVLGFVFVMEKCTLLTCLHSSPILPPNNDSVSASRDSEVIIHKAQILWTTGVKVLGPKSVLWLRFDLLQF